jgi:hypothetical protein
MWCELLMRTNTQPCDSSSFLTTGKRSSLGI